jgi:glycosyltransferase involved in cell wall biosynthesis
VIEDLVPLPRLGSGFGRTNQIINTFLGLDYAVTVFVKSDRIQVESSELIQHLPGVKLIYAKDEHTLENFIEKNHTSYDVIWVCRTHSIKLVNNAFRKIQYDAGRPKLVLDTEAIASTRDYTLSQILDGPAWTKSMFRDAAASELDGNSVFDHVVLVNEFEKDLVDGIIAPRKTDLLRLKFDNTNIFPVTKSSWSKRTSFLFAGAVFDESSPNYDSLKWFVYKIWPEVRKEIPTAKLNICGYWEPRLLSMALELAKNDGIQFLGAVNDLDAQYNACRVFIAPTRFGAGIPVKIQESVNFGLPVVTTPLMARQLGWNAGQGILFDSSKSGPEYASQFAKDCVRLYSDYDLWKTTRSQGFSVVKRDCNEELFKRNIMNILSH